jgi:hypothetical protein
MRHFHSEQKGFQARRENGAIAALQMASVDKNQVAIVRRCD